MPIDQVTDGFRTIWRDGQLNRENRIWTIKAQSDPFPGELPADLHNRIRGDIEAIELPDGYTMEWDGEYGNSKESNENLASTIPLGLLAMVLVVFVFIWYGKAAHCDLAGCALGFNWCSGWFGGKLAHLWSLWLFWGYFLCRVY